MFFGGKWHYIGRGEIQGRWYASIENPKTKPPRSKTMKTFKACFLALVLIASMVLAATWQHKAADAGCGSCYNYSTWVDHCYYEGTEAKCDFTEWRGRYRCCEDTGALPSQNCPYTGDLNGFYEVWGLYNLCPLSNCTPPFPLERPPQCPEYTPTCQNYTIHYTRFFECCEPGSFIGSFVTPQSICPT